MGRRLGTPISGNLANCSIPSSAITGTIPAASITGTLAVANGGTGDTGTAWTTYTSTFAASTGTATTVAKYKTIGKTVFVTIIVTFTSGVTGVTTLTLPSTASSYAAFAGKEVALTGISASAWVNASSNLMQVLKYDGSAFTTNASAIICTGVYESAT